MNDLFLWEIEDARGLISEMRGDPNAFDFLMQMHPAAHHRDTTVRYTVTVVFDGRPVQYLGGYGLDWVGQLELDICRGVFGREFGKKD